MTLGVVKEMFCAEYEVETGERKFTKYVSQLTDVVDIVGNDGGVIRAVYSKEDGNLYRAYGGQRVAYTGGGDGWDKGLQGLLESGDYDAA